MAAGLSIPNDSNSISRWARLGTARIGRFCSVYVERKRTNSSETGLSQEANRQVVCRQARRRGGSKGSNEPPFEVNNGGLKTQTVHFQLLGNTGGMENKLRALQLLNYPARKR